ncbi:MAG: IMP dehydrogenase [Candidatus Roizmanbacteria bacterium]|nr:IMP dehydrogenase [Candidatus Roizmanbacteria bacterium]
MNQSNKIIAQGITYDDVLLIPGYSSFKRQEITLKSNLTKSIVLDSPFVSAPMDTVTESELAIAIAREGGIGIIHRNLTIQEQADNVDKVKKANLLVGAAVGASQGSIERAQALVNAKVDVLIVDSAHGYADTIIDAIKKLKATFPTLQIIGGNVATYDGAQALIEAGVDGLRVGMGPGAICTTRIISGMGVPQITAIIETSRAAKEAGIPIIADGGISYSGDMVKAFAAGASTVMMGSMFASCQEAPGAHVELPPEKVPSRFKSILKTNQESYTFKSYRGMGSISAMQKGTEIKSEDEFHGKSYNDRVLVAEGVEGLVPVNGPVKSVTDQMIGGIRSGMYYVGTKNIAQLQEKGEFIQITQASLSESHPHDILVTNGGGNY